MSAAEFTELDALLLAHVLVLTSPASPKNYYLDAVGYTGVLKRPAVEVNVSLKRLCGGGLILAITAIDDRTVYTVNAANMSDIIRIVAGAVREGVLQFSSRLLQHNDAVCTMIADELGIGPVYRSGIFD